MTSFAPPRFRAPRHGPISSASPFRRHRAQAKAAYLQSQCDSYQRDEDEAEAKEAEIGKDSCYLRARASQAFDVETDLENKVRRRRLAAAAAVPPPWCPLLGAPHLPRPPAVSALP